jgi:hypothetical protein
MRYGYLNANQLQTLPLTFGFTNAYFDHREQNLGVQYILPPALLYRRKSAQSPP